MSLGPVPESDTCFWEGGDAAAFAETMLARTRDHGVVFFSPEGIIRGWNQGAHFITGFTAADVIGQPAAILFTIEDRAHLLHEHELETARVVGVAEDERWHVRKDGSRFWSTGVSLPLGGVRGAPHGFVKVFRDATHLRTRMKYLENVIQECNGQRLAQDRFVVTAAHELRNPLAPMKMALELLFRRLGHEGPTASALGVMERQMALMTRLVEDLVDVTRIKSGKLGIVPQTVVLQALLAEAMDGCSSAAVQHGVALHSVLPSVPLEVGADPERLGQVVVNLLNNAIKFTPAGGAVWLTATVDATHFLVQVKDNGQGIAPELLPKIFDAFTQADGTGSHRGAGLGLGLAIVKEIVSLHGGTIEIRSEGPGKGAEFMVRIPLRPPTGPEREPMPRPVRKDSDQG